MKQFYHNETHYAQHEHALQVCILGHAEACKEWNEVVPKGLINYLQTLRKHVENAKAKKFDIRGAIYRAFEKVVDKFKKNLATMTNHENINSTALAHRSQYGEVVQRCGWREILSTIGEFILCTPRAMASIPLVIVLIYA